MPDSTSDTERPDTPDLSKSLAAEELVNEVLAGSDDAGPSDDGYHTAMTSGSSGSLGNGDSPESTSTPDNKEDPFTDHAIPHNWPVTLSPDQFPYIHALVKDLGVHSADGSSVGPWANTPVSYISSEHPLGPRELAPGHYACPYPGCVEAFGLFGQLDGYIGRSLVQHVYRRHGTGTAVDLMSLGLQTRVMELRREQGKTDLGGYRLPRAWIDPGRDLVHASVGIIRDLEEIRAWELSRRFSLSIKGEVISMRPMADLKQPALPQKQNTPDQQALDKGKGRVVASRDQKRMSHSPEDVFVREATITPPSPSPEPKFTPSSQSRQRHAAQQTSDRARQHDSPSLKRIKEALRSPSKSPWDSPLARRVLESHGGDFWELLGLENYDSMDMD